MMMIGYMSESVPNFDDFIFTPLLFCSFQIVLLFTLITSKIIGVNKVELWHKMIMISLETTRNPVLYLFLVALVLIFPTKDVKFKRYHLDTWKIRIIKKIYRWQMTSSKTIIFAMSRNLKIVISNTVVCYSLSICCLDKGPFKNEVTQEGERGSDVWRCW